ncbi:MAG TPA: PVC-type heme-binding CxxCH protein [Planctomycetota bacterium]|nr:PVC-type heme-binding CxxCH protein [Planctomycetota bacterium]
MAVLGLLSGFTQRAIAGEKPEVPPGFELNIFAAAPEISAPTTVSATPKGELFVGEDPLNVRCKESGTGQIKKLIDTDGDGKCDKITLFATKINNPRGTTFVDGSLYVVHQPFLTVFRDEDGDGVAEKSDVLITGLGPVPEKVPPDHAVNGIRMAIDGWMYIAVGDQGVPDAVGKDGSKLQLRGGGIVRCRPDGTELEIYVSGLRNVYDMAQDALFNGFTRDNTNDGDGWNVRFSQIVQTAEYGYPSLYQSYSDEILAPLHDFGGGSGTGAMWVHEPAFGAGFNNHAYTNDWGRSRVYKFVLEPNGSSFKQTQEDFLKGGRPTDIDMDGVGRMYITDWSPHSYGKSEKPFGHIYQIRNTTGKQEWPDLAKATETDLVTYVTGPSMTLRVEAQRALLKRPQKPETIAELEKVVTGTAPLYARVAALFTIKELLGAKSHEKILGYAAKPELKEFALRALTDRRSQMEGLTPAPFVAALKDADPRVRMQAAICLGRLGKVEAASALLPLLADGESNIRHVAMRALRALKASDACLAAVGTEKTEVVEGALRAMRGIHTPEAVSGLIKKAGEVKDPALKAEVVKTIGRLYYKEGAWDGSWWAIRPDTRGPYYLKATWEQSDTINKFLNDTLNAGDETVSRAVLEAVRKFQILTPEMMAQVTKLAEGTGPLQAYAIGVLLQSKEIGPEALALLEKLILNKDADVKLRAEALQAFEKVKGEQKIKSLLALAPQLDGNTELQVAAFSTLMKLKDPQITEALNKAWTDENKSESLINAVLKTRIATQYEKMRGLLKDKRANIRKLVMTSIAELKDGGSVMALLDVVDTGDEADRHEAVRTLARVGRDRASQHQKCAERVIELAQKNAGSKNEAFVKDLLEVARVLVTDKRFKPEEQKAFSEKLPKVGGARVTRVADLKFEELLEKVMKMPGDKAVGAELYKKQTCVNCHTLSSSETPKGPFLGDIGVRYQRKELCDSIVRPSNVIAFGFNTHLFTLENGERVEGFVAKESGDELEVRNISGEVKTLAKSKIKKQVVQKQSTMPEGLVDQLSLEEFASLLAYLESLKAEKK